MSLLSSEFSMAPWLTWSKSQNLYDCLQGPHGMFSSYLSNLTSLIFSSIHFDAATQQAVTTHHRAFAIAFLFSLNIISSDMCMSCFFSWGLCSNIIFCLIPSLTTLYKVPYKDALLEFSTDRHWWNAHYVQEVDK